MPATVVESSSSIVQTTAASGGPVTVSSSLPPVKASMLTKAPMWEASAGPGSKASTTVASAANGEAALNSTTVTAMLR